METSPPLQWHDYPYCSSRHIWSHSLLCCIPQLFSKRGSWHTPKSPVIETRERHVELQDPVCQFTVRLRFWSFRFGISLELGRLEFGALTGYRAAVLRNVPSLSSWNAC